MKKELQKLIDTCLYNEIGILEGSKVTAEIYAKHNKNSVDELIE